MDNSDIDASEIHYFKSNGIKLIKPITYYNVELPKGIPFEDAIKILTELKINFDIEELKEKWKK